MKRFVLRVTVFLGLCALRLGLKLNPDCSNLLRAKRELRMLLWKQELDKSAEKADKQLDRFLRKEDENDG